MADKCVTEVSAIPANFFLELVEGDDIKSNVIQSKSVTPTASLS